MLGVRSFVVCGYGAGAGGIAYEAVITLISRAAERWEEVDEADVRRARRSVTDGPRVLFARWWWGGCRMRFGARARPGPWS
jgi:O-acetyl-ADP-ribose deacetylase (regulator of RNase III)